MTTSKRESKERQKRLNQGINKRAKALNLPGELIRYQVAFEGFLERVFKPESFAAHAKPARSHDH